MDNKDTGLLLNAEDIKIHRQFFVEMAEMWGIKTKYKYPLPGMKTYDLYGELDTPYSKEKDNVFIIFDEHPTQYTMKKLGWVSEMDEGMSVIHVPYDLEGIQVGCLFKIPGGIDNSEPRTFRVVKISNITIYPASLACEVGPMMESTFEKSTAIDFTKTNFNLLNEEEDY